MQDPRHPSLWAFCSGCLDLFAEGSRKTFHFFHILPKQQLRAPTCTQWPGLCSSVHAIFVLGSTDTFLFCLLATIIPTHHLTQNQTELGGPSLHVLWNIYFKCWIDWSISFQRSSKPKKLPKDQWLFLLGLFLLFWGQVGRKQKLHTLYTSSQARNTIDLW